MTTVVTISAHCGSTKEVHVVVTDAGSLVEEFDIADGEKAERYAYDARVITVREVVKIDRRAKDIEDAEFSLRQAALRFEDAASRGFPLHNADILKADVVAKHAALDALATPAPSAFGVNNTIQPDEAEKNRGARALLDALDGGVHFTAHALVGADFAEPIAATPYANFGNH